MEQPSAPQVELLHSVATHRTMDNCLSPSMGLDLKEFLVWGIFVTGGGRFTWKIAR